MVNRFFFLCLYVTADKLLVEFALDGGERYRENYGKGASEAAKSKLHFGLDFCAVKSLEEVAGT